VLAAPTRVAGSATATIKRRLAVVDEDELPKVTLAHLRRAETMCRRKLAREHAGLRGRWNPSPRFAVSNRLVEDARLAHAELRAARPTDFPPPNDLLPEQQLVYLAAAGGYVAFFDARPARAVSVDAWETELPGLGVRLVGSLGLALETADGAPELRMLKLGVAGSRPLIDDAERRVIVVRSAAWVGARPLRLVMADLLAGEIVEEVLDVAAALPEALDWVETRVTVVKERALDPVPKAGADCHGCAYVPGCHAHEI
jgi:hypothetical protein